MKKGWIIAAVIGFVIFGQLGIRLLAHSSAPRFQKSTLTLTTLADGKAHKFNVEVANSDEEKAYGLMFRHYIAPDAGMIFLFEPPEVIQMWMKNTFISLDMVFLDRDGKVTYVKENAQPQSEDIIASPGLASAVIELKGGDAKALNIRNGDTVDSTDLRAAVPVKK